jgi:hypothetical protein
MLFTYGTHNFEGGGIDDGSYARLRRQLARLAKAEATGWAFQECRGWLDRRGHGFFLAEEMLGMRGFIARSAHYGCDVAVFVRESAGIRVTGVQHEEGWPYFHAVASVFVEAGGIMMNLASAHFTPSSPEIRLAEAEEFKLVIKRCPLMIVGADFNGAPARGPDPDLTGIEPDVARRKLDRRAALALEESGLIDVGAHAGDQTPTVGHGQGGKLAYRCDRVGTTLPVDWIVGHHVPGDDDPLSDHKAAVAVFDLPVPTGTGQ